jgi:hypothetical protein
MRKQSALEAAVEPEGELVERSVMVLKFTAGIGTLIQTKCRKQQLDLES